MGGIGEGGVHRDASLWKHRIAPPPRPYIRNRSADTCRQRAAPARSIAYTSVARELRTRASLKNPAHFALQVRERCIQSGAAWIEHNPPGWRQLRQVHPDRLAEPPAKPVADHGFAQSPGDREPDPGSCKGRKDTALPGLRGADFRRRSYLQTESCEEWTRVARALVIHLAEVAAPENPDRFRKSELRPCDRNDLTQLGSANRTLVTDGELVAAPGTAAGKDSAAILGLHAGAESMRFGALAIIWLKRTLWHLANLSAGGHTDSTPSEWSRNSNFTRIGPGFATSATVMSPSPCQNA